jgi:hypothetical protein
MVSAVLLSALLERCAPAMDKRVAAAIVEVESHGDSWAIDDDTERRSYHPRSYAEAVSLAHELRAQTHTFDLGLGQVNSVHIGEPAVTVETMLRPCANLAAAQRIFGEDFAAAGSIRAALVAYNGAGATSQRYADLVLGALHSPFVAAVTGGGSPTGRFAATPFVVLSREPVHPKAPERVIRRVGSSFGDDDFSHERSAL